VTHVPKRSVRAAVFSAVVACAVFPLLLAGPAQAAPPCWKTLINDWYDSTIDGRYPIPCYQQAVAHLPTDARLYSSAKEDILRAMTREVALKKAEETPTTTAPTTTTTAPPPTTTAQTTTEQEVVPPPTTTAPTTTEEEVVPPPATTTNPGRPKPKGVAKALDDLNPGDADSFPLPLLILGALAILLVAAGIVGMIWRRMDRGDTDADAGPA
jgi:cobalamin biosynthesis Mg chelatase CobN